MFCDSRAKLRASRLETFQFQDHLLWFRGDEKVFNKVYDHVWYLDKSTVVSQM